MIATTRLVNIGRTVMPYASWAAYAIQLGYVGYNLYHYYQEYLAQVERDQRSNTQRALNETIELVVAPRRRRRNSGNQPQPQQQQQTTTIQEQTQQGRATDEAIEARRGYQQQSSGSAAAATTTDTASDVVNNDDNGSPVAEQRLTSGQEAVDTAKQQRDRLSRDERVEPTQTTTAATATTGIEQNPIEVITIEDSEHDDDEILSDAETALSLESTDSNRGIIKDLYNECFICARTLNDPNKQVATLPFCLHPFHKSCLDGVLKWHSKCPVCDFNIFSPI